MNRQPIIITCGLTRKGAAKGKVAGDKLNVTSLMESRHSPNRDCGSGFFFIQMEAALVARLAAGRIE